MSAVGTWQVTVVVAAYNEALSLPLLHPRLRAVLDGLDDIEGRVLYIDDGSSDDNGSNDNDKMTTTTRMAIERVVQR